MKLTSWLLNWSRRNSCQPYARKRSSSPLDVRIQALETRCLLTTPPNDLLFAQQVGLNNLGQTGGVVDADIDAPEAWDVIHDSTRFVTAVIDSGIDYTHSDLYLNVWLNQGEIPLAMRVGQPNGLRDTDGDLLITFRDLNGPNGGVGGLNASLVSDKNGNGFIDAGDVLNDPLWENGTDEDGNGLEDDVIGWDFANNDNDPFDDNGHGTHVSGILAASGNNGIGVAGVNWQANLMVVKFLDNRLHADVAQAVSALEYVTQQRMRFLNHAVGAPDVRISNNSWEIRTVTSNANVTLTNAIEEQLRAGMLVVAAAGNGVDDRPLDLDIVENPSLPAAYVPLMGPQQTPTPDAVLSVAASDTSDRLVFSSNFGLTSVDLTAPGLDILSTEPGGRYGTRTGTSMAAPFVAGTAALVWARFPEATALEIKQAVLQGVDTKPALAGKVATGGRLNAARTLDFDTVAPRAALTSAPNILVRGGASQDVSIRYTDNVALNVSSLGASDITVVRADGVTFNTTVSLVSVTPNTNGSPRDVVYRITAPSGTWTNTDNATYRISLLGNEVADTIGNKAASQLLGSFEINIPNPDDLRVTSTVDAVDGNIGDGRPEDAQGRATLRAAIQESNSNADANTIKLGVGTFTLTLAGAGEDVSSATGDLDIRQNLTIEGVDTATSIIDAASLDRVFHVQPGISLTLRNLTIRGGSASDGLGGGGILNGGFLTLDHVTLTSNTATSGGGGGVLNNVTTASANDTLTILDSTLSFNTATGSDGGGLKNLKGKASIQRSTFHNNAAGTSGGGLSVHANTTTVTNATFSTNTAETIGGGLHLNAGVLLLTNVTTTLNTADSAGGGLARTTGTARLVNTIVSGNTLVQSQPNIDVAGTISATGSGNNLVGIVGNALGFDASRQDIIGTTAAPQNANLAPLANYGGPTLTHRPNVGSGVIDTGVAVSGLTVDQRGLSRTNDGDNNGTATTDIGSVEFVLFGSISGLAFHDFNQNGQRDTDEPGLSGWTIFLDTNNDGVLDVGERSTVTSNNGSYVFSTVAPGSYVIAEVLQTGWMQTLPNPASPTNGRYSFTLAPGEDRLENAFGNFALPGEIRGTVFLDLDGDTIRDAGEVAYPNLTVFLDANHNGVLDPGEPSTETDNSGAYAFLNLPTARTHYRLTLVRPPGLQVTAPASVDLSTLNGTTGFRLDGINVSDNSGRSVSSAGDVNGDGFDDLLIGAYRGDPNGDSDAGESYVVFGKSSGFAAAMDLSTLDGTMGFRLDGIHANDRSGVSVSNAGDVNGDGFDDLIIGSPYAAPNGNDDVGESYIVFGKSNGFGGTLDLASLDGTTGFRVVGSDVGGRSGHSVSNAGDVNGDGFDDLLIGAFRARPNDKNAAGKSYVVFGKSNGFTAALNLSTLDGTNGFRLDGIDAYDQSGVSVSSAGDVNGDGFDDIIVGAYYGDPNGIDVAGESYVVFGKSSRFVAILSLNTLNGSNGFRIDGIDHDDLSGRAVASAGDVNGDGFDDLLIGAVKGDPNGKYNAGECYVVFGKSTDSVSSLRLSGLNGTNGFQLNGVDAGDRAGHSVSSAGDVNDDGFDDLIVGARDGDPHGKSNAGESYVVFGKSSEFVAALELSMLDGTNGFRLDGNDANDYSGGSVSNAGDVNGDGFDDIIVGAYRGDPNGYSTGESYVVFGRGTSAHPVFLSGGEVRQGVNFGLQPQTASIRGELFQDRNRNGVREDGEDAIVGASVFIDANTNDRRDAGELIAVTDSNGRYAFSNLDAFTNIAQPSRTYRVVDLVSDDRLEFVQTVPQRSLGQVEVTPFAIDAPLRVGNDIAADGLGGFLLTGSEGSASGFNEQSVFRVSGDGLSVTTFAAADHPQGVTSDGTFAYWADQNADSNRSQLFRQPLAGGPAELISASSLTTGSANELVAVSGVDVVMATGAGALPMLIAADSVRGRLAQLPAKPDVSASEITPLGTAQYSGFLNTARPQFLEESNGVVYVADPGYIAPGADRSLDQPTRMVSIPLNGESFTTLFEGSMPSFTAFGETIPGSVPRGIAVQGGMIYVTGDRAVYALPITGGTPTVIAADERFDQLAELTFFNDALYVIDNGNVTEASATVWKIDLHTDEPLTRAVHVDETSDSRAWDLVLTPGMVATDVDFARYDPNAAIGAGGNKSISGRLFQDLNGNGVADAGEPGLVGQVVYLDLNHNGMLDPSDLQTTTLSGDDPSTANVVELPGTYVFTGLEAGLYDVLPAQVVLGQSLTTAHEIALSASDVSLTNATPRAVTAGDVDRDGDNDVVIVDSGNGNVSVLTNSGDQSFATRQTLTVSGVPYGVALGNFDSDTFPDLAVSRLQFGHVAIAKNLGNGQFETIPAAGRTNLILSSPGGTDFGAPSKLISHDFNNDGRSDLATIDISGTFHRVFVWLNLGNLTFSAPQILTLAGLPSDLVAADFNNDGALDLAATDFDSDKVHVWLNRNNGMGLFDSVARQITVGDGPLALAVGDFDGRLGNDLAVANQLSGSIMILSNDGAANFTRLSTLSGTSAPSALSVADFDGRNGPDLAVTQGNGDSAQPLMLFFNSGDVAEPFTQSVAYGAADLGSLFNATATSKGFALAAVNLDRDSDPDLVVVNSGAKTVSTLRNGPGRSSQTVRLTTNGPSASNINFGTQQSYDATFDAGTGQFTVTLPTTGEVEISGLGGFVELHVNGVLDTQLTVSAAAVRSIVVQGSLLGDRLDLSGVSSANGFTNAMGVSVRLVGNDGPDTLTGSGFADAFVPGAGDDVVVGGPGTDTLEAVGNANFTLSNSQFLGLGTDVLTSIEAARLTGGDSANVITTSAFSGATQIDAGAGNDSVLAGAGHDFVTGGAGADSISGGDGFDTVFGGTGNDTIDGGLGNDLLNGQDNDDSIIGGDGVDVLVGGAGTADVLSESTTTNLVLSATQLSIGVGGAAVVESLSGFERAVLFGSGTANVLDASAAGIPVTMFGGGGNDVLISGIQADNIDGQGGNDTLTGGVGNDTLNGGAGTDGFRDVAYTDVVAGQVRTITLTSTSLVVKVGTTTLSADSLLGFEFADLTGGAMRDFISANAFTNTGVTTINGGGGNDVITGTPGADMIFTATGADSISGGAGSDTIFTGSGNDTLNGGDGADNLNGQNGNDSILGDADNDVLIGGAGIDTLSGGAGNDFLSGQTEAGLLSGGDGNDSLQGNTANDTLNGDAGDDRLYGLQGDDVINGGDGADSLVGAIGNDSLSGGAGLDTLQGDLGNDTLDGGADFDRINEVLDTNITIVGITVSTTSMGSDTVLAIERIQISGGAANNFFDARQATVPVFLSGGVGNDTLLGGSKADGIVGNDGDDVLSGGAGNDVIDGGAGTDYVVEKANADFTINGVTITSAITATGTDTPTLVERIVLIGGVGANKLDASLATVPVVLLGGRSNDTLFGGSAGDTLSGGNRNDGTVVGGDGSDSLDGGGGADILENDPLDIRVAGAGDTTIADVFALLPSWIDAL